MRFIPRNKHLPEYLGQEDLPAWKRRVGGTWAKAFDLYAVGLLLLDTYTSNISVHERYEQTLNKRIPTYLGAALRAEMFGRPSEATLAKVRSEACLLAALNI